VSEKAVENPIQRGNIGQIYFENEAVLPRDSVALCHLRNLLCQIGHFSKLPWQGANAHKRNQGIAKSGWIEIKSIRATRSVTAGLDISTCLANSDIEMRGFPCKIDSSFKSVSSTRPFRFKPISASYP
jgi:hypothetical protein